MDNFFSRNSRYMPAFYRYRLNHVLFWIGYIAFWTCFVKNSQYSYDTAKVIGVTIFYALFQAPACYLAMYSLIPKYLYKKKYLLFLLYFIAAIVIAAALVQVGYFLILYIPSGRDNLLQFEQEYFQRVYPTAFGSTLYIVMLLSIYKILKDRITQESRNKELEHEKVQAELNFLKAQINPHFLFNAINSIYFLIKKDQDTAGATLIKFSDMLRYQLYECNAEKIPLQKELDYLKNYIELERLRKSDNLAIDVQLPGDTKNAAIAPFMLMPIIENAFKYVSNDRDTTNRIIISLSVENNLLTMYTANTKEKIPGQYPVNKASGIGLSNLKRRLDLLYRGEHELQINTNDNLYEVTLKIQLNEDQFNYS